MEYAKRAWKKETKEQLKTAWTQIRRSARFGLLLYIGYLFAQPSPSLLWIALLSVAFLAWEYEDRKEVMAETERAINKQAAAIMAPLEEKHVSLELDVEEMILVLAAVERKTRG